MGDIPSSDSSDVLVVSEQPRIRREEINDQRKSIPLVTSLRFL